MTSYDNWTGTDGRFGIWITNDRGFRLVDVAKRHRLTLVNTYPPQTIRTTTQRSPNGKVHNLIDFIYAPQCFKFSINKTNTRTFPISIGSWSCAGDLQNETEGHVLFQVPSYPLWIGKGKGAGNRCGCPRFKLTSITSRKCSIQQSENYCGERGRTSWSGLRRRFWNNVTRDDSWVVRSIQITKQGCNINRWIGGSRRRWEHPTRSGQKSSAVPSRKGWNQWIAIGSIVL